MAKTVTHSSAWVYWSGAALVISLAHVLIDVHIGLYGKTSPDMSFFQASNLFLTSLVYGWWLVMIGLGVQDNKSALVSALIMNVVWAFLWNGLIVIFVAPPPSAAYPFQDIAHIGGIIVGGVSSFLSWKATKIVASPSGWLLPAITTVVLIGTFIVQSMLGLQNM